jgi:hypothetical protein
MHMCCTYCLAHTLTTNRLSETKHELPSLHKLLLHVLPHSESMYCLVQAIMYCLSQTQACRLLQALPSALSYPVA